MKNFTKLTRIIQRNIAKAFQLGCSVSKEIPVDEIIKFEKENGQHLLLRKKIVLIDLIKLLKIIRYAKTYGVYHCSDKLLSSCVFFFFQNSAYYMMVGNHPEGKEFGASHVDRCIYKRPCWTRSDT